MPGAVRRPGLLTRIHKLVAAIPGVDSVDVNAATGSLVIHHRRGAGHQIVKMLARKGLQEDLLSLAVPEVGLAKQALDIGAKSTRALAKRSPTARTVVNSISRVNRIAKQSTGNVIDLRRAVMFGVAVIGIVKSIQAGNAFYIGLTLAAIALDLFAVGVRALNDAAYINGGRLIAQFAEPSPASRR